MLVALHVQSIESVHLSIKFWLGTEPKGAFKESVHLWRVHLWRYLCILKFYVEKF